MSDKLVKLEQQYRAKTLKIENAVAQALGVGAKEAQEEARNLIDGFENSMMDGKTPNEWQAHEINLAAASTGRLLVERYEIAEQILDIQDEHLTNERHGSSAYETAEDTKDAA